MNTIDDKNNIEKKIQKLENSKLEAIQNQRFEEAAMIRDRISKILSGDLNEVYIDQIIENRQQKEKEQKERGLFEGLKESDRILIVNTMKRLVKRAKNSKKQGVLDEVMEDILLGEDSAKYNGYFYDILNIFKKREGVKKGLLRVTGEEVLWEYLLELTSKDLENLKRIFLLLQEQTRDLMNGYRTMKDSLNDFELKEYMIKFGNIRNDEYTNSMLYNMTNYMDHLGRRFANFEFLFGTIVEEIDEGLAIKNTSSGKKTS